MIERMPAKMPRCDPAVPVEHLWQSGAWGVIIGVSRCLDCGRLSRKEDFPWLDAARATEKEEEMNERVSSERVVDLIDLVTADVDYVEDPAELVAALHDLLDARQKIVAAMAIVNEQSEREDLWFKAEYITEDLLQRELRRLHAAIEGVSQEECALRALGAAEGGGDG